MKKLILLFVALSLSFGLAAQQNPTSGRPFSPALVAGDLVFLSGKIGSNPATGQLANESFEAEVRQIMENLSNELKTFDLTLDDLVSTIVYLKDMKQYDALNSVYGTFFKERFPTRTCIAVADLPGGASVEISGIAHLKK